ncbi:MAG: ABC transporter ATP-binding protein [Candidatus Hodarchaeales archaeon]
MSSTALHNSDKTIDSIVKVENLKKDYHMGGVTVHALRGIDMDIARGKLVSIVGPSGCGKTTLLNMIGGLDKPTEGRVLLNNIDLSTLGDKGLTNIRRHEIGFIFQSYNLLPVLSATENVELPMLIAGVPREERQARARELLRKVGLEGRRNHRPDQLSGGERQRVSIARSLANKPAVLLSDEPTGDLDSENGQMIMELLKDLNRSENQTILVVTHDMVIASQTDMIFKLRDGRIEKIIEN